MMNINKFKCSSYKDIANISDKVYSINNIAIPITDVIPTIYSSVVYPTVG